MASKNDVYAETPSLEYSSGKALMQHGPDALHEHVSSRMEIAMGKALPQMEVRFKNLSISADVIVSTENDTQKEQLPTLANEMLKGFSRFSAKKAKVTKHVLRNVNGVFKPDTLTLVLGQPGSGKSSLMKILSGRFPMSKKVKFEGEVTYNGATREEITKRLPQYVSYVTQRDYHFPTLTVKETLDFAHECCGGELSPRDEKHFNQGTPEENKNALDVARALYHFMPEVIIQQLGLENCQNTIVGNGMLRGVSGGERKRVTTGEMQFGNKYVNFMDEISTGLDSAAAYDIIKTQRGIAKTFRKTIVIALLQPSPEIFDLFDNVLIMNDGYVMYHGPREKVMDYFQSFGFRCPPIKDAADFLMDLGTRQQVQYEVERPDGSKHPRKAREFAELFEKSEIYEEMLSDLHGPLDPDRLRDREMHFDEIPEFHQSFVESTKTLIVRQTKVTMRNTAFLKGRALMISVMGLINGSVFYQVDVKNAQIMLGVIFMTILFLAFGQASQIPTFLAQRAVFYKQRGANFYRTSSYVLACLLNQVPIAILETLLFGSMMYWMCGFVSSIGAFVVFELILLLTNLTFAAFFFALASASPDLHVAKPLSMVAVVFVILYSGFLISKSQIQDFLVWLYWINPLTWCLRAISIIQYGNSHFDVDIFEGTNYKLKYGERMGKYSLSLFDLPDGKKWIAFGFIYLAGTYLFFMFLSWLALEYKRYESPENITLGEEESEKSLVADDGSSTTGSEYGLIETPRGDAKDNLALEVAAPVYERLYIPVTLAFKDLHYWVPDPANPKEQLELLKGITGFAKPGSITALMGSSGAGKTTLMDVIAGRKTGGRIEGQILLNGYPATDLAIRRATGYCEQMDVHSEAATIREAFTFSAFLRQSADVPDSQKYDTVEEVLDLLDMRNIADQIIRGSSVEQMKRLTIGVELAAQPSVLFLDEPTSGLDARSAKVIMDGVRKVANSGRTVVCTIHQPSWEVFHVFDSLLLLKRGGQTVYFGELGHDAKNMIQYFESIPGTAKLEDGYNPATWMLEVIGAGVGNTAGQDTDFVSIFEASEKKRIMDEEMSKEGVLRPASGVPALEFSTKRAARESVQARFLIQRFFAMYWRTPSYNLTRLYVYIFLALFFGISFSNIEYDTFQGLNAAVGMIFMTSLFVGTTAFNSVLPISSEDRAAYYRERASQTYNALWYFVGSTIVEVPYVFASCFVFVAILFPIVGFKGFGAFLLYWLQTSMVVLLMTYFGQLLAYAMPSVEVAAIIGVLLNSFFFIFMGFNPPAEAIPQGYKWLYQIIPHRYTLEALTSTVLGNCKHASDYACKKLKNVPPTAKAGSTVEEYIGDVFLMHYDHVWRNFFILLVAIVVFRLLGLLALRYLNHQKR